MANITCFIMYPTLDSLPIHGLYHGRKMVADEADQMHRCYFFIMIIFRRKNVTHFLISITDKTKKLWSKWGHVHGCCRCFIA